MPETKRQTLRLHQIPVSPRFQHRKGGVDAFHVSQLREDYLAWKERVADGDDGPCPIPPPVLFKIGNVYHVVSGFHRIDAMRAAGFTEAEFEVHLGATVSEAAEYASLSNLDHKGLKPGPADLKAAFLMYWDHCPADRMPAVAELARKFRVARKTIDRYVAEAEAAGGKGKSKTRVDKNGKDVKAAGGTPAHKSGETGDLFEVVDRTGEVGEPEGEGGAQMRTPTGEDEPADPVAGCPVRRDGEYPPDPRFMPNAEGAQQLAVRMASWKQRMEAVRAEMRQLLPKGHPVGDQMVEFRGGTGQFAADLNALIETLGHNQPVDVCPMCVGTNVRDNGDPCETCHGYGFVTATDAAGLKSHWKRTGRRYDDLCKKADMAEVEA